MEKYITPSMEKFFHAANKDLINEKFIDPHIGHRKPYTRYGKNLILSEQAALIVRYAEREEIRKLIKGNFKRIAYLIDDDLESIIHDKNLNLGYRTRIYRFKKTYHQKIRSLATDIIAPSSLILKKYGEKICHLLGPCILNKNTDFSHFDETNCTRMVYLGTRSHVNDLKHIARDLSTFLRAHPEVTLETFLGKWAPQELQNIPNARHHAPCDWPEFKKILSRRRWHLALSPMLPTMTNAARSWNKLLDHAAAGAAGIYSQGSCPTLEAALGHGKYGFLIPNSAGTWREFLEWLLGNRDEMKRMAISGHDRAIRIGNHDHNRKFWKKILMEKNIENTPACRKMFSYLPAHSKE